MLPLIFAGMALFIAGHGYAIKHRGRIDIIAGVKDPSALKDPEALGNWVGNMSFVSRHPGPSARSSWLVPSRYLVAVLLPTITLVFMTGIATAMECQSRAETR